DSVGAVRRRANHRGAGSAHLVPRGADPAGAVPLLAESDAAAGGAVGRAAADGRLALRPELPGGGRLLWCDTGSAVALRARLSRTRGFSGADGVSGARARTGKALTFPPAAFQSRVPSGTRKSAIWKPIGWARGGRSHICPTHIAGYSWCRLICGVRC